MPGEISPFGIDPLEDASVNQRLIATIQAFEMHARAGDVLERQTPTTPEEDEFVASATQYLGPVAFIFPSVVRGVRNELLGYRAQYLEGRALELLPPEE